ncbi:MAG: APC family permease [Acidimicrobiales bacterium]
MSSEVASRVQPKRWLLGRPLATMSESRERLGRPTGLAVLSSDAISSTAYASEEVLRVLVPVIGLAAVSDLLPIALIVSVLITVVVASYHQTIRAYPNGGGAYIVARENLGQTPALVAAASLLVDYVLTAAVSISAGVAAIVAAYPPLAPFRVELCLAFVAGITLANLRGLRESGRLFVSPTFAYIVMLFVLIGVGLARSYLGGLAATAPPSAASSSGGAVLGVVTPFLLLRAFSSGAIALTGIEAVSNGVPAFRPPEARNAASTLTWMGLILGSGFLGVSLLAGRLHPVLGTDETLLSVLGKSVLGGAHSPLYLALQLSTFAILVLAANTAFADFPRLSSIVATDGFMPRQFARRGDRLVFSQGIVTLAVLAAVLLVVFRGDTSALIPLYAVGVFNGFTLSQAGMVRHHLRHREQRWQRNLVISGLGALATGTVLLVVLISKFVIGAWIPAVLIPLLVVLLKQIARHYDRVRSDLALPAREPATGIVAVVLVAHVNRAALECLAFARLLQPDALYAAHVELGGETSAELAGEWASNGTGVNLDVIESPYRDLTGPILGYLDSLVSRHPGLVLTVVTAEYVERHRWENLLHNQSTVAMAARLRDRSDTVVVTVPVHARAPRAHRPTPA